MLTFNIKYEQDIFTTLEKEAELVQDVKNIFNLPVPDALEVKLSPVSIHKIKYYYSFMKEHNISKMEFYLFSKEEKNSFTPMLNGMTFDSNEYVDFGNVFFNTFKTDGALVIIDKFSQKITFSFHYNNGYTEQLFYFSSPIKVFL